MGMVLCTELFLALSLVVSDGCYCKLLRCCAAKRHATGQGGSATIVANLNFRYIGMYLLNVDTGT